MFPNFRQSLSSIGTGNMSSESYVEAKTVLDSAKSSAWRFLLFGEELYSVLKWSQVNRGCLYSLVLARGLFLKRFPPLIHSLYSHGQYSQYRVKLWDISQFFDFDFQAFLWYVIISVYMYKSHDLGCGIGYLSQRALIGMTLLYCSVDSISHSTTCTTSTVTRSHALSMGSRVMEGQT